MYSVLFIFFWFLLSFLFLINSKNLLLSLILLEIIGFFLVYTLVVTLSPCLSVDFLVLSLFCIFVMEGVVALSGLIMLVNFVGSDYISSSSFLLF